MFPSVNVFESLYSSRQRLYLSNSLFSKNLSIKFCLMLKNMKFSDTDKTIGTTLHLFCIKITKQFYQVCKVWRNFTEGNSSAKKLKKQALYIEPVAMTTIIKVNNNRNVIARVLLILLENFVDISHRGKLGFLKHCSPIYSRTPLTRTPGGSGK